MATLIPEPPTPWHEPEEIDETAVLALMALDGYRGCTCSRPRGMPPCHWCSGGWIDTAIHLEYLPKGYKDDR